MSKRIAVVGTGYVGLVTGVSLSEIGNIVTCIDINKEKIDLMIQGKLPFYEPDLEEMMINNIKNKRLYFTSNLAVGLLDAEVIYIAVGTPENEDGSANLLYIEQSVKDIAEYSNNNSIVVLKSTVPVGTHKKIQRLINSKELHNKNIKVVSNPEFLREGSALHDTFNGSRIVIGSNDKVAANIIEEVNRPFGINIFHTDPNSAEMIKYASNAFLATKISFINEIANICEKVYANIDDVAHGMGLDNRIGTHFLKAGIGYGGSCFPKDTKALTKIAENINLEFNLLKSVIEVNIKQQNKLFELALTRLKSLNNKKIAILGLAFKPNTDDVREAASIVIIKKLIENGAEVVAYDPIANENAKLFLPKNVRYANNIEEALIETDLACILTEWEEIKGFDLSKYSSLMKTAIILDGRNCYPMDEVKKHRIEYYSIGRPMISFDT